MSKSWKVLITLWALLIGGYILSRFYQLKCSWIYILPTGTYPTFDVLSHYHFTPLTTTDLVIPKEYYFVHGNAHPSFDSRYKEFGLVSEAQIYGKAYPLW